MLMLDKTCFAIHFVSLLQASNVYYIVCKIKSSCHPTMLVPAYRGVQFPSTGMWPCRNLTLHTQSRLILLFMLHVFPFYLPLFC